MSNESGRHAVADQLDLSLVDAEQADATQAVLMLAGGTLDEAGYTAFLRANTQAVKANEIQLRQPKVRDYEL